MPLQYVKKGETAKPLLPSRQPQIYLGGASQVVRKAGDVAGLVVNGSENFPEDHFAGTYMIGSDSTGQKNNRGTDVPIIEPFIKPGTLKTLVMQNNMLNQCVEVMEVNIDGTGHTIEKLADDTAENKAELKLAQDFFAEPYPGKSMVEVRRTLRRDLEDSGCGYLEVGCNLNREPVTLNWLDSDSMRLVRLDDPIWVEKPLTRAGKEIMVKVRVRERRFVQLINGKRIYFKEFGASRDLNRFTGEWAEVGETIRPEMRASEVMYFTVNKEPKTPYGTPRWINQLPSVLGSRKAEEHNLEFFDAGGLPPVLVLVQGGYLGDGVGDQLRAHLSGTGAKHRAAIVEALSSSGSLDSAGTVKVSVERFGAERQQDGMFQGYDERCAQHVRVAFRLPPMFFGLSADYNFATAMTAYMTVEAQVFAPERLEFDNRMNQLLKRIGVKSYRYKSKPISLTDVENQLKVIELGLTNKVVKTDSAVSAMNALSGLELEHQEPPDPVDLAAQTTDIQTGAKERIMDKQHEQGKEVRQEMRDNPPAPKPDEEKEPVKKDEPTVLVQLANEYAGMLGISGWGSPGEDQYDRISSAVNKLEGGERKLFNAILASKSLVGVKPELDALGALCGCAAGLLETA